MKILVMGANGQIGSELIKKFSTTSHDVIAMTRNHLDCANVTAFNPVLFAQADVIINATGYTWVDKAEEEINLAFAVNADFVNRLAIFCDQRKIPLIHLSTDYVFDGLKSGAYNEADAPNPQGIYAQSKRQGELAIISQLQRYIILRVSWVFGVHGRNFIKNILSLAQTRTQLNIVGDQWGRPTSARDIARVVFEIVEKIHNPLFDDWGIYHYAGAGATNWHDFAAFFLILAKENGLNLALKSLVNISSEDYPVQTPRPKNSVLSTSKIENILNIECHSWQQYLPEVINHIIREAKNYELSN